ncbi:thrombospondin type 3 repeat-containing protein [Alteromonas sp. BZK5]|uniref:thrombospondin type 3 repeat-containing protein n=1 Tax=Alteromonas sp. BZK5 TaxID=1904459 RepID=UPI0016536E05|nr:thrombospondin type 3 repeat-containing protein [Alteromonas sp. BZK5]MBC6987714.1 thrombospondin type 3 repeat-containing protein [Alteromonas sp. BZK5]
MNRLILIFCFGFSAMTVLFACMATKEGSLPASPAPAPIALFDSDNDGVMDNMDLCPSTPLGIQVDASGCQLPCLTISRATECSSDLPAFTWPIPKPSSYLILRNNQLSHVRKTSIGEMVDSLEEVLGNSGYSEFKYYSLPKGIVMVTQLERINEMGAPFAMPDRWDINDVGASMENFDLAQLLRVLVGAEHGYYRVLVFVLMQKDQVIVFDEPLGEEKEITKFVDGGAINLPGKLRQIHIADDLNLTVLVYEMVRKRVGTGAEIYSSGLSVKSHLDSTEIQL